MHSAACTGISLIGSSQDEEREREKDSSWILTSDHIRSSHDEQNEREWREGESGWKRERGEKGGERGESDREKEIERVLAP